MEMYSKGDYPIQQVIFVNIDSVLGSTFIEVFKNKYGEIDIIHQLRQDSPFGENLSSLDLLMMTTKPVVSTCWTWNTEKFNIDILKNYLAKRNWDAKLVRVYCLMGQLYPEDKVMPLLIPSNQIEEALDYEALVKEQKSIASNKRR